MAEKLVECSGCKVKLINRHLGPVAVDECPACGGIWFTKDELRQAKDASDSDLNWLDFEIWKNDRRLVAQPSRGSCPACGRSTAALTCGHTGVSLDYCDACQGAWLERGDFARLIEALQNEVNSKSFSEYAKETLAEAKEIVLGEDSFLSEWKDLATVVRLMQYRLFVEHPEAVKAIMSIHRAVH